MEKAGFVRRWVVLLVTGLALVVVVALALTGPNLSTAQHVVLLFGPETNLALTVELRGENLLVHQGQTRGSNPERYDFVNDRLQDTDKSPLIYTNRGTRYTILSASRHRLTEPTYESLMISVKIQQENGDTYEQYADGHLRPTSKAPAVAHFHGPLTIGPQTFMWQLPPEARFVRGGKTNDLRSYIGTMDAKKECWTVVKVHERTNSLFANGVFPYAEIQFPPKEPHQPSPKERFPLQDFC